MCAVSHTISDYFYNQMIDDEKMLYNYACDKCGYRNSLYGDVNNDGFVDNLDLLLLRQILSGLTV